MPSGMTIQIELHPMYVDFLRHTMGPSKNGRVFASEKHRIGLLIKNLLRKRPANAINPFIKQDQAIEFILPSYTDIDNSCRNYISPTSRRVIASKIRSYFYFELHEFIIEMKKAGIIELRSIIVMFCEQFEIDEDNYKVNTLEREYARYRERLEIVKKTRKITSVLSLFLSISCLFFVHFIHFF